MATNLSSRTWFLAGMTMLCTLRVGVKAFRLLGPRASGRSSTSAAGSKASSTPPDLANLRENYISTGIDETMLPSEPHILMNKWVEEACSCKEVIEPNAMCLATAGEGGKPSARFVLMKGYDERGVTWYTNYNSRKSQELKAFPHAAITFWWGALHRSVRFEGEVDMVSEEESDEYFSCRPRGSKIGAWVSDQSEPIASREEMNAKAKEVEKAFASEGDNIPRPRTGVVSGFDLRALSSGRDSRPAYTTASYTPVRRRQTTERERGRLHDYSLERTTPTCLALREK